MSRLVSNGRALGLGFLGIGVAMLGIAGFLGFYALSEARIGRGLVDGGVSAQALLVSAERVERAQCSRSQRAVCWEADNLLGTVVYQIDGLRSGAEVRLREAEFDAYLGGEEVFIDLIYLPSLPTEVEREQGSRLSRAEGEALTIAVAAFFGLIFTLIGGIALLVTRRRGTATSTGPDA